MKSQVNKNRILETINIFRNNCNNLLLEEINCSSLISHNDHTLRFVNSTTSVMKPYIEFIDNYTGIYLVQPSVGFQGVLNWKNKKIISPYSSYFIAIGTLSPMCYLSRCIQETEIFLTQAFGFSPDDIILGYYFTDVDFKEHLKGCNFQVFAESDFIHAYRHCFGSASLTGRNINIYHWQDEHKTEIGNVIIIENSGLSVGVEVSFDIPLLIQSRYNYVHAVDTLPAAEVIRQILPDYRCHDGLVELADLVTLGINLMIDGLKIKSRGREGNLKLTIKLVAEIVKAFSLPEWKLCHILRKTIEAEKDIRKILKYSETLQCNDEIQNMYIEKLREMLFG